jgi:hypothetical protein
VRLASLPANNSQLQACTHKKQPTHTVHATQAHTSPAAQLSMHMLLPYSAGHSATDYVHPTYSQQQALKQMKTERPLTLFLPQALHQHLLAQRGCVTRADHAPAPQHRLRLVPHPTQCAHRQAGNKRLQQRPQAESSGERTDCLQEHQPPSLDGSHCIDRQQLLGGSALVKPHACTRLQSSYRRWNLSRVLLATHLSRT